MILSLGIIFFINIFITFITFSSVLLPLKLHSEWFPFYPSHLHLQDQTSLKHRHQQNSHVKSTQASLSGRYGTAHRSPRHQRRGKSLQHAQRQNEGKWSEKARANNLIAHILLLLFSERTINDTLYASSFFLHTRLRIHNYTYMHTYIYITHTHIYPVFFSLILFVNLYETVLLCFFLIIIISF